MPKVVVIESLSKRYVLGRHRAKTLRDELAWAWAGLWTKNLAVKPEHWALRDFSLEIKQGEMLGIIGKNGAGKSTLLKIMSRITAPTSGVVKLRGRVASLLEVGTGFHRELSGRENIYLNGAILGMHRLEIRRKFDEIVAFAGVESHIDTAVKYYSSGMFVRLAFAVAAHLEPEILIVDEVLAVGDLEFQQRAIGKMKEVSQQFGRTVLFVSHQMAAIRHLCERTVVLENGRLGFDGQTHQAVLYHHQQCENLHLVNLDPASDTEPFALIGIRVSGQGQEPACLGLPLFFNFAFRTSLVLSNHSVVLSFRVDNALGEHCLWLGSGLLGFRIESPFVEFSLEKCPLPPGKYQLTVSVRIGGDKAVWRQNVASFEVVSGDFFGTGKLIPPKQQVLYTDFTIRNLNAWEH